jgi:phosphoglycerate dehydrogenase-like enzyme
MRRGVTVTSSAGANATSVAHAAIAGLLALNRGVPGWVRAQDAHHWQAPSRELTPRDLPGQHAVIVGTGAIGSEIARVCRALHMRVTGLRQQATPHPDFDAIGTLADLPALAPETDWLILCCPLTAATRGVVDAGLLARLPPRASLINVGRGELVVEPDLFDAMQRGALAGVFSDVFVNEPLPADSPWWTLPRTLLSSHLGGLTDGFARRTQEIFLDNLQRWLDGREMRNVARAAATPA